MSELLAATPGTVLWGELPCASDSPIHSIDPGDTLVIDTVSHEGILEDQGRDPVAFFTGRGIARSAVLDDAIAIAAEVPHDQETRGPHVVTGPIEIRGALPGDVVTITVLDLQLRCDYGIVSNRHGRGALPGEFPQHDEAVVSVLARVDSTDALHGKVGSIAAGADSTRRVRFPLRPFLGTMGVAVAGEQRVHSVPPGPHGGNIDVSLLTEGAKLHLPVQVEGAGVYIGDPHYAQGDGEVALTAFEAPLRATLRFDLVRRAQLVAPRPLWAETSDLLIPIGLDSDLNEAMRQCVRAAIAMLVDAGMDAAHAYAYLSAAGDFAVSQVVDRVCGIHGKIRKSDLVELLSAPS